MIKVVKALEGRNCKAECKEESSGIRNSKIKEEPAGSTDCHWQEKIQNRSVQLQPPEEWWKSTCDS